MYLPQASNARNSELSWSQARETIVMLYLSTAQIESSMQEGSESVYRLTDAFTSISNASSKIQSAIDSVMSSDSVTSETQGKITTVKLENTNIQTEIQDSVIAFQFHDRITQRLEHVTQCLKKMSKLIGTREKTNKPADWLALQEEISASYTMESEKIMFEHITMGASVEDALERYNQNFTNSLLVDEDRDEIELF